MSCKTCKKVITDSKNEERNKIRQLAKKIAGLDGKTQVIIKYDGKISITCEDCWIKGGRIGTPIEYIIV